MIRASSLFYALMVALLLGALLNATIMNAHLRSGLTERWLAYNVARDDAYGALEVHLLRTLDLNATMDSIKLFPEGERFTTITQAAWGLFDIRTGTGRQADQHVSRTALLGWCCDPSAPSLWIADGNQPISLAGDVQLLGTSFLPERGLRRAFIDGRPYSGALRVEDQRVSSSELPPLPERVQEHIRLFVDGVQPSLVAAQWSSIPHDSIHVGFSGPPLVADIGEIHELANARVTGHVILLARDSLRLASSFHCSGIIICAPYLTIASGFSGDLQCFTRFGALLEPGARLQYPSVLLSTGGDSTGAATITIAEGSTLEGAVIGWPISSGARPVTVEFAPGTTFDGELWNDGPVQLHGVMTGTVVAGSVMLRTPSSEFQGHISDVMLRPFGLQGPVGVGIWGEQSDIGVVSWLDRSD